MTERQWQAQVEGLARFYGWRLFHAPDNRPNARGKVQRVTPGFPDLFMVRDGEALAVELKTETGRVAPAQREWLDALAVVPGIDAYVWRPADFDDAHARLARGRVLIPSVNRPA